MLDIATMATYTSNGTLVSTTLDENTPESYEHLWHLAHCFSLCLVHPDGSHTKEIRQGLHKVNSLLRERTGETQVQSDDIVFTLQQKGVWLKSECGDLKFEVEEDRHVIDGEWTLTSPTPPLSPSSPSSRRRPESVGLSDEVEREFTAELLEEVMDELLRDFTSQFIIFYTFVELNNTWRERAVRKNQRRMLQRVKDSKVQTLGDASRIVVGDQMKTLTTSVDIQLLQDISRGLEDPLHVLDDDSTSDFSCCSSLSSTPLSPTNLGRSRSSSATSDTSLVPVLSKYQRGSQVLRHCVSSFDVVLEKKDKFTNAVALAMMGDGLFQKMLRDGVRVIVHHLDSKSSRVRRLQRVMKWKTKKVFSRLDDMISVSSDDSSYQTVINKLEFYKIDAGVIESVPENYIVIDDIVAIYTGSFTQVLRNSLKHLHGDPSGAHHHHDERIEHENRCFSLMGCQSCFDNRLCVDIEVLPRNNQFIKVQIFIDLFLV